MKRLTLILVLLGICVSQSVQAKTESETPQLAVGISVSFGHAGYFYSALSPYGDWLEFDAGFHVWRPRHVRVGWRPYLYGRWVWTDFGWYWVSSEPFGWAVFHYGRWYYDDYYGWVWVPDRIWGPAWVEWRYDDDFIGWAPLPPYASFSFSFGIRFTTRWFAPAHYWSFVRHRHFCSPYVVRDVVGMDHTRRLIRTTRSAGRYDVEGDRVINRGVDRSLIERRGYTRIERVDVREATERGERLIRDRGRERVEVYRPNRSELEKTPDRIEARRAERRTSLDIRRVERPRSDGAGAVQRNNEGERRINREEFPQRPEDRTDVERRRRDETLDRLRESRTWEIPQPRTLERRSEPPRPSPQREQVRPQPERREVSRERPQQQRQITPPRTRIEAPRSNPEVKRESPRGSETGRRDGGRRRD